MSAEHVKIQNKFYFNNQNLYHWCLHLEKKCFNLADWISLAIYRMKFYHLSFKKIFQRLNCSYQKILHFFLALPHIKALCFQGEKWMCFKYITMQANYISPPGTLGRLTGSDVGAIKDLFLKKEHKIYRALKRQCRKAGSSLNSWSGGYNSKLLCGQSWPPPNRFHAYIKWSTAPLCSWVLKCLEFHTRARGWQ